MDFPDLTPLTAAPPQGYALRMQSLAGETIRRPRARSGKGGPAATDDAPPLCARAMLDGLPQVMWFIRQHMRRHRTRGLSVPQFRALVLMDRFPEASLSAIAEHLGSTLPSASRLVTGLVDKGLVVRESSATDRRQLSLVLTPRGRSVLAAAQTETLEAVTAKVAGLTDAERETITRAMGLLLDVFANVRGPVRTEEPAAAD